MKLTKQKKGRQNVPVTCVKALGDENSQCFFIYRKESEIYLMKTRIIKLANTGTKNIYKQQQHYVLTHIG